MSEKQSSQQNGPDPVIPGEADRPGETVPIDDLFEILAAPGNRYVLTYLVRREDPAEYADLVEYVVDSVAVPEGLTESEFRGRVAARLVHSNLPKLEASGLVVHHSDEQRVTGTETLEAVVPYIELALEQSRGDRSAE